jgi:hypothetical protein
VTKPPSVISHRDRRGAQLVRRVWDRTLRLPLDILSGMIAFGENRELRICPLLYLPAASWSLDDSFRVVIELNECRFPPVITQRIFRYEKQNKRNFLSGKDTILENLPLE